jgi:hypothetical protein
MIVLLDLLVASGKLVKMKKKNEGKVSRFVLGRQHV